MEKDAIATISLSLSTLNLFSVLGGQLETLSSTDGETIRKQPAYINEQGQYRTLVPDQSETAICFFKINNNTQAAQRNLRTLAMSMVCWINNGSSGVLHSENISSYVANFLERQNFASFGSVDRLVISDLSIQGHEVARAQWAVFDLSEQETQYLMHPYQCFALNFTATVAVKKCTELPVAWLC
jgi:hypothetical protein